MSKADKPKHLGILLFATPYSSESTSTVVRLARSARAKGHRVTVFAYGDSVHNFTKGQKATGITNAESEFSGLISEGLSVQLCGTCLAFRGIGKELLIEGAEPSSMRNLCALIDEVDRFISFT